jgi:hypothetical protein
MLDGKFDWLRRRLDAQDLSICLAGHAATARAAGRHRSVLRPGQARGGRRWDTSSLIHLLAND